MNQEQLQKRRLNTVNDILLGYCVYTFFFIFAYYIDLINIDFLSLCTILTFVWSGNLIIYFVIKGNFNLKLKDPDLVVHMIFWSIICIIVPTYFMSSTLRSVFIMNYFIVMLFGSFKLNLRQFLILTSIAVASLGFVISFVMKHNPNEIKLYNEILLWGMFTFVAYSFAFICNSISEMRVKLKLQREELRAAFSDIIKISVTDELTNIYNRRYALDFIANMKLKTDKGIDKFVICMIDIDFFKVINDTYGHDVGDLVLKTFTAEVNKLIRHDDCLARFGGEEFLLILSHIDLTIAEDVLNRILKHIREITFQDINTLKVTASIGATSYIQYESIDSVIKRADTLLYQAKQAGRNRFILG